MMKIVIINLIIYFCCLNLFSTKTCVAEFTYKKDANTIYNIYTKVDYVTTIQLPNDKDVKHIITDASILKAESDGKFVFIEPLETGIFTSLSIITTDDILLSFNVIEITGSEGDKVIVITKALIKINISMIKTVKKENNILLTDDDKIIEESGVVKKKIEEEKRTLLKKINTAYRIKDRYFNTKSVLDDGNFTYININNQLRPVVYLNQIEDELKPLNFVDEDGVIIINHVLNKNERFVLKIGKKVSFIRKIFK